MCLRPLVLKLVRAVKRNPNYRIDERMPSSALMAML
jgi:hypothetical protein